MAENALDFARSLYERTLEWYKNADSKAQIILTLNGAFVAFLTSNIFKGPDEIYKIINKFGALTWILLALMTLCLVGSIISALACLWSRVAFSTERDRIILSEIKDLKEKGEYSPHLMMFFKTIALLDAEKFQNQLAKIDEDFEIKAIASQCYLLSKRVSEKHLWANRGFVLVGGALIFFLLGGVSYLFNVK